MKKRFIYLIFPIITLVLEILPYGAVCNFAVSPEKTIRKTYSYFDLLPFGYANVAPFLTALATCAILLLLLIYCATGKKLLLSAVKYALFASVPLSLCPLAFGIRFFSPVGALITVSLISELLLILFTSKSLK